MVFKYHRNPHIKEGKKGFFQFLLWQLGYYRDPFPLPEIPADFIFPNPEDSLNSEAPRVTWINHSTFLIQAGSWTFLTDPIWSERCSPFSFFGPKRHHPPPFRIHEIPQVDVILISHNHYDHLDLETVRELHKRFPNLIWIIPEGIKKWFKQHFLMIQDQHIMEMRWWDQVIIKDFAVQLTAVPSQHFSGRGVFDRDESLWLGYVVETTVNGMKKRFYFAGDTGYNAHDFKEIGNQCGPINLALLPIGCYRPRRFMQSIHVHPEESVRIHQDVQAQLSVAGHWGTFRLSEETLLHPPYDLYLALQQTGIPWEKFRVLKPGQAINW